MINLVSSLNEGDFLLRMLCHDHICKMSGTEQAQSRSLTHRWALTLQSSASYCFPFSPEPLRSQKGTGGPASCRASSGLQKTVGKKRAQRVVWAQPPIGRVSPLKSSEKWNLQCPLYRGMQCPLLSGRAETRPGAEDPGFLCCSSPAPPQAGFRDGGTSPCWAPAAAGSDLAGSKQLPTISCLTQ